MNRRGFLGAMLAAGTAPALVRAESLMKLWVPPQELVSPPTTIWHAQMEQGAFGVDRLFSAFIKVGGGPMKRVSVACTVPPGVAARCVINRDGTLDVIGGTNKSFHEHEVPHSPGALGLGTGHSLQADHISQKVPDLTPQFVYHPHIAGSYAATPEPARMVRNSLLSSEDFSTSFWATGGNK